MSMILPDLSFSQNCLLSAIYDSSTSQVLVGLCHASQPLVEGAAIVG